MSIEEFLDGMPIFDECSFSQFYPSSYITKRVPVYITTTDTPSEQEAKHESYCLMFIVDQSNSSLRYYHKRWNVEKEDNKRESDEVGEASCSSSKRPRV